MKVKHDSERNYDDMLPVNDEGWWESVLAEEKREYTSRLQRKTLAGTASASKEKIETNSDKPLVTAERNVNTNLDSNYEGSLPFADSTDKRAELFGGLRTGACVKGIVTSITDFGVFVDIGGMEGLIHISELSWGRVSHPSRAVRLGDEIEVQVLDFSAERRRIALSLKRTMRNPWEDAEADFAINTIQTAVVSSILSYGAFARLKPGIEGLIHISKMPLGIGQTPRDLLTEGQQVQVQVLYIDPAHQRMGLRLQTNQ